MTMADADFAPIHFSSEDLPARERIPFCREVIGRQMVRLDIERLEGAPFRLDMTMRRLPALRVGTWSTPALRVERTPALIDDDDDVFCLIMELGEKSSASARGRTATLRRGEAMLGYNMDPCVTLHSTSQLVAAAVPRAALASLVANAEDATIRTIPADNEALRLLPVYLRSVYEELPLASPELRHLVTTHVHDLVALAVGATRDGAAQAVSRGLSAARLVAIKADIVANLSRRDLSLDFIAGRHGLSARHIRRLFSAEDTSFSDFVLEQRLLRAYRMLGDPRFADRAVSAVAYECGFGDLSYFNRCFRRRFGASPTQFRGAEETSQRPTSRR